MKKLSHIEQQLSQIMSLIQQGINKKNLNTAALAKLIDMERKDLKRILTGQKDITMRDFISISTALELEASMLDHQSNRQAAEKESMETLSLSQDSFDDNQWSPAPLENHTRQLVEYGFALGCDMLLLCNVERLQHSNIPQDVMDRFRPQLPIQLDAEYHPYNKPQYHEESLELKLSFDALYTCFLPWNSIKQIIFRPQIEEIEAPPEPPSLRLV